MCRIKISQQDFALKMLGGGGLMREDLQDTTVYCWITVRRELRFE